MILKEAKREFITSWIYGWMLKLKYGLSEKCHMIVLSDYDPETDYYAIKHLKEYYKRFYLNRVVVVSKYYDMLPDFDEVKDISVVYKRIDNNIDALIKSVSRIHSFYIRIIDLSYPEEKMLEFLPGVRGMTKEEIICKAEYQLFTFEKAVPYEK